MRRVIPTPPKESPTEWLLDGDPSIRWQTLRDLVGAPARTVSRERGKIAREGWGARLLDKQGRDGRWAGGSVGRDSPDHGLYTPKWISTTYTLLLLRDFGLPAANASARKACKVLLDRGLQHDGGVAYGFWKVSETCVTGMTLSLLSYFEIGDRRVDSIARHMLRRQMPDGGWNCKFPRATHASVHTTISALEGLRHYELLRGRREPAVREAQQRGREFLLQHRLFRSHRTGRIIKPEFTRFAFPPRWHYDVLRALDYFQAVGAPRDARLNDAIEMVRSRRDASGRWPQEYEYHGKTWFRLERVGAPGRWNTLRALRVLKWWDG